MHQKLINIEQIMCDHEMPHLRKAISAGNAAELDMPHCVKYEEEDGVVYRFDPPIIHFYPLEDGRKGFQIAYISREDGDANIFTYCSIDYSGNAYAYDVDSVGLQITEKVKIDPELKLQMVSLPDDFEYDEPKWLGADVNEDDEPNGPVLH